MSERSYQVKTQFPDREEAGTPNILGAVTLAYALAVLGKVGMSEIFNHEQALISEAISKLSSIKGIEIYGLDANSPCSRVGSVAFNIKKMGHGLVAAVLNDYHNVAVRNGCFCAHPYVRTLLKEELWNYEFSGKDDEEIEFNINLKRGMVRASFGIYSTSMDIDALVGGLEDIIANADDYRRLYTPQADGSYKKNSGTPAGEIFHLEDMIQDDLSCLSLAPTVSPHASNIRRLTEHEFR